MNEEYTKRLENVIKQMLTPLKGIPLNLVIESISALFSLKILNVIQNRARVGDTN